MQPQKLFILNNLDLKKGLETKHFVAHQMQNSLRQGIKEACNTKIIYILIHLD